MERGDRRRVAYLDQVVIAAFDARMILIARNQHDDVVIAVRVRTLGGNFAEIVNLVRFDKL